MNPDLSTCSRDMGAVVASPEAAEAYGQFAAAEMSRVFCLIYRIVGNVEDAQDLTQETYIKVLLRSDQLKDEQKAAHWLSRIATNTSIDFLRRRKRVTFTDIDDTVQRHDENPERILLRTHAQERLEAGLRLLTPRERSAIMLRDVEEHPAAEVARLLGCSQPTVRSHIANARIKLRRYLDRSQR